MKQKGEIILRLEKRYIDIERVVFDSSSFIDDCTLYINREELIEYLADPRLSKIEIEIAHPGESCRLTNVGDVVQPMFKPNENIGFPGVVDDIISLGDGATAVVRGVGVIEVLQVYARGVFFDMSGPATEFTPLAGNIMVAVNGFPAEGIERFDYFDAMNTASKKAAHYIGKLAAKLPPDDVEIFEMNTDIDPELPRVVYLFQIFSHGPYTDMLYYGDNFVHALPIIIHPNEILDGAVTNRDYLQLPNADPTFLYQNHPLLLELYNRHGKDINWVGTVMYNAPHEVDDKKRNAMKNAQLARYHFDADIALLTKEGGGHPQIDLALACDLCEDYGIRTVLMSSEFQSAQNIIDESVLFTTPNADAIITPGCILNIQLPAVERIIGMQVCKNPIGNDQLDFSKRFDGQNRFVRGAISQLGGSMFTSKAF